MSRKGATTASMGVYDAGGPRGPIASNAGLVLLYAPEYASLPPSYPLLAEQGRITIGREAPAAIVLAQPAVSRSHAQLVFDQGSWVIADLGARNGTLVNGAFIQQCRLRDGDQVRVGDAFFKFVEQDAEQYQHYRIDGAVLAATATPQGIVGGLRLARISAALERIAMSGISVILLGESGTGKEVFARQIHQWSGRTGAFCALNCAAIPPTLLESELFGYRRGAFSGADRDKLGLVRAADHGTLFLDEVGDMPLEAQSKLLRVLQAKEVMPLGATTPEQVDVRVVCATHRDLGAMQREKTFRGDLYARLNEYNVTLPPLRERKEDVFALCLEFLRLHKRPDLTLTVPYMTGVLHYNFPYNVRELEGLIKRGIALADGPALTAAQLSSEIHDAMRAYGRHAQPGAQAPFANTMPAQVHSASQLRPPESRGAKLPRSFPHVVTNPEISAKDQPAARQSATDAATSEAAITHHAPGQTGYLAAGRFARRRSADQPTLPSPTNSRPVVDSWVPAQSDDLNDTSEATLAPHASPISSIGPVAPDAETLKASLTRHRGNVAAVGRDFGKQRMQVHRWMKKYDIDPNTYR